MNFDEKIDRFHREVRARDGSLAILDPAPFRLLRRAGIRLPPPVFQPMWLNGVVVFLGLDIPLTGLLVAWPYFYPDAPLAYLLLFSFISTIASASLALLLSLTWWHRGRKLGLPGWHDYDKEDP